MDFGPITNFGLFIKSNQIDQKKVNQNRVGMDQKKNRVGKSFNDLQEIEISLLFHKEEEEKTLSNQRKGHE